MEDQDRKFVCKWCNRCYPCGKSLGGHTRSHMIANSVESVEKKISSLDGGGDKSFNLESQVELGGNSSYGLRENPRKSFKAVDAIVGFPLSQERNCKQCGKGFHSLKALCGHMACHSEKDKGLKDDHSWTSENQKLAMDDDDDDDSHSDTESDEDHCLSLRSKGKSRRNNKRIALKSSSLSLGNGSSSVSEIDEQDQQQEVAVCLMLLSRDASNWGGVNSVVESSDNHSVVLETKSSSIEMKFGRKETLNTSTFAQDETLKTNKLESNNLKYTQQVEEAEDFEQENSDSGYFLGECEKGESVTSVNGYLRNAALYETNRLKNVSKVGAKNEETLVEIRKTFNKLKSTQAELREDMNKERGNEGSALMLKLAKYDERKKNKKTYEELEKKVRNASPDAEISKRTHKRSKYECINCKKTFNSYQGLGGHRPCHKRTNSSYEQWYETGENSLEADTDSDESNRRVGESLTKNKVFPKDISGKVEKKTSTKKSKSYECPYCPRIFKNGQALGGHKRSHFLGGGSIETKNRTPVANEEQPELLDLNLPAPTEDEADGHIVSW